MFYFVTQTAVLYMSSRIRMKNLSEIQISKPIIPNYRHAKFVCDSKYNGMKSIEFYTNIIRLLGLETYYLHCIVSRLCIAAYLTSHNSYLMKFLTYVASSCISQQKGYSNYATTNTICIYISASLAAQ